MSNVEGWMSELAQAFPFYSWYLRDGMVCSSRRLGTGVIACEWDGEGKEFWIVYKIPGSQIDWGSEKASLNEVIEIIKDAERLIWQVEDFERAFPGSVSFNLENDEFSHYWTIEVDMPGLQANINQFHGKFRGKFRCYDEDTVEADTLKECIQLVLEQRLRPLRESLLELEAIAKKLDKK